MLRFADRLANHEQFRPQVAAFLQEHGCLVHQYGVERMAASFHEALVRCALDPTAQFLRFQPDEALVVVGTRRAYLCEIKTTLPNTKTGRVAYEIASRATARQLATIGIAVFVVFGHWKAAWVADIEFTRVFDDPAYLASVRAAGRGSGTPFGVFSDTAAWLKPLAQFVEEDLGCQPF